MSNMIGVYILKSLKDGNKYIGSTKDISRRLSQHNKGEVDSTMHRRPLILVGFQETSTIIEAVLLEKKYKNSHGALERAFKKGLFHGV